MIFLHTQEIRIAQHVTSKEGLVWLTKHAGGHDAQHQQPPMYPQHVFKDGEAEAKYVAAPAGAQLLPADFQRQNLLLRATCSVGTLKGSFLLVRNTATRAPCIWLGASANHRLYDHLKVSLVLCPCKYGCSSISPLLTAGRLDTATHTACSMQILSPSVAKPWTISRCPQTLAMGSVHTAAHCCPPSSPLYHPCSPAEQVTIQVVLSDVIHMFIKVCQVCMQARLMQVQEACLQLLPTAVPCQA